MKSALALSLATLATLGAAGLQDGGYKMTDGRVCPLQGSATSAKLQALDRDKNRSAEPTVDDIDTDVTLAAMLAPGDDETRFDNKRAARVVGFVAKVKAGGAESCNCKAKDPVDRDTHIELALAADAPQNQRVVAEVTPRLRLKMKTTPREELPNDWITKALQSHALGGVAGHWIEVTGWLLFDAEHVDVAENTNPGHAGNERATCWEIHPITDIRILDGPPENTPVLAPVALRQMQQAHAAQAARDPARKQAIEARIQQSRALYAEDLDGDRPK